MVIVIYAKNDFVCANKCAENEINGQNHITPSHICSRFMYSVLSIVSLFPSCPFSFCHSIVCPFVEVQLLIT